MEVMGLVDQDAAISECQEDNPVPLDEDLLQLLTTAIGHFYFQQYCQVGILYFGPVAPVHNWTGTNSVQVQCTPCS